MTAVPAPAPAPVPGARHRRRAWGAGWAALLVAAAFCIWAVVSYWHAAQDPALRTKDLRDQVKQAGVLDLATLTSVKDTEITIWQHRWLAASAGALHATLQHSLGQYTQQITRARSSADGSVVAAAVTALDPRAGTAHLIASMRIIVTPDAGAPATEISRYAAAMTRTPDGWKVSSLTAIPAGST
jgi:Mce-associated membrane protein